jgi:hypothetical protein
LVLIDQRLVKDSGQVVGSLSRVIPKESKIPFDAFFNKKEVEYEESHDGYLHGSLSPVGFCFGRGTGKIAGEEE